jgi:hypothetical protein
MIAAQVQALPTKYIARKYYKQKQIANADSASPVRKKRSHYFRMLSIGKTTIYKVTR